MPFDRFFLLSGFTFLSHLLAGQPTRFRYEAPANVTFHYNVNWELTTPEKSAFRREAYFNLQDMVFDGVYRDYTKDNKLIAEGYYAHGAKSGIETEYFEDQSIKSTIEFSADDFVIWQLVNDKKEYLVAKGTGKFSMGYYFFFDYYLKHGTFSGEFQNGKRTGPWVYYDAKNMKTDIEYYDKGKLIRRIYYTKTEADSIALRSKKEIVLSVTAINTETLALDKESFSTVSQYFETQVACPPSFERNVSYPGGIKHLIRLLTQQTEIPIHNLVLVKMKVNEHGQVSKSVIVRSVDPYTDERVLKALEIHLPRFLPAMKNGLAYATTIYLPVSGGDEWEKLLNEMPADWFLDVN